MLVIPRDRTCRVVDLLLRLCTDFLTFVSLDSSDSFITRSISGLRLCQCVRVPVCVGLQVAGHIVLVSEQNSTKFKLSTWLPHWLSPTIRSESR